MLPSLSALRAFEAAARHGSFRAAADMLVVTPTAISHHIRGLEDHLGVQLFLRSGRQVTLTEDGRRLAEATGQAFGLLEAAVQTIQRTSRQVVRIAAGPIFTARWLMPRIGNLWDAHPDLELEVVPSYRPSFPDHGHADIVIKWARMQDMPATAQKLLELRPVVIANTDFAKRYGPFENPSDLLEFPMLHQKDHWGWTDWFAAMGVTLASPLRGAIFQDANALIRGAADGQGAIIGWLPLIEQDLRDGRVVRLFDETIAPTHAYFLQKRTETTTSRAERQVINWLVNESAWVNP